MNELYNMIEEEQKILKGLIGKTELEISKLNDNLSQLDKKENKLLFIDVEKENIENQKYLKNNFIKNIFEIGGTCILFALIGKFICNILEPPALELIIKSINIICISMFGLSISLLGVILHYDMKDIKEKYNQEAIDLELNKIYDSKKELSKELQGKKSYLETLKNDFDYSNNRICTELDPNFFETIETPKQLKKELKKDKNML